MTLADETLLRYADGTLSSAEARAVEEQLAGDEIAMERLRFLRIGGTALAAARDHDLAGAPVDRAQALIDALGGVREVAPPTVIAQARTAARPAPAPRRSDRAKPWRMAAGIALFAIGLALGMTFAPKTQAPTPMVQATAGGWIDVVVEYQSLYSRATIEPFHAYPDKLPETEARLAAALGAPMHIPDLSDVNLEFRQGRQLDFKGKTIIQLVYLPAKEGKPIALCAIKKPVADMDLRYLSQEGMGVVQWAHGGVEFLLVGEEPKDVLETAARSAMVRL